MSSGSKETVLGAVIFAVSVAYVATLAANHARPAARQRGPVRLVAPSPGPPQAPPADPRLLRVCADPNNLPFSDRAGRGFENRLAELVARDLGKTVAYYWQPQRRGFVRTTLKAGACDVVMGMPSSTEMAQVTRPYYRSSYVFVTRRDRHLSISSLDDPRLRTLRIGIPITGTDYANPPAAQALADRHIIDNVHGFMVYGDYSQPHPSWGVLDAVVHDDVDVAIEWGPLAGYFAHREDAPIDIVPVKGAVDPRLPFAFDISMAVRRGDTALASALDRALDRHRAEIDRLLASYGVPVAARRVGVQG